MKSLLLISLLVFVMRAETYSDSATLFVGPNQSGRCITIKDTVRALSRARINNEINSVRQTGIWVYYENINFNEKGGKSFFVYGTDVNVNFPEEYRNIMSSARLIKSMLSVNQDMITLFEGKMFAGREVHTSINISGFSKLAGKISSLIITGTSPWTVYTGQSFTGNHLCVHTNTDNRMGSGGHILNIGFYPDITDLGLPDDSILSVRKGCLSRSSPKISQFKLDGKVENGGWGRLV